MAGTADAARHLDRSVFVALHNVTLATAEGSTPIAHVVISRFGIFAIETKNMQSCILGSERQPQWMPKIHQRTFPFQHPLHQNHQHTQALQAMLQVPPQVVHSVIAFVGRSYLPADLPTNVTQGIGCIHFIQSFMQPVLTTEQVHLLVQQLQARRLMPTRATHWACTALGKTPPGSAPGSRAQRGYIPHVTTKSAAQFVKKSKNRA